MTGRDTGLSARVVELRDAFDRSFAESAIATAGTESSESLVTIGLGPHTYALRLSAIARLLTKQQVTWVPSPVRELLGIASVGGVLVPVYDLRALLGVASDATPEWLVIAASKPVGLAFDRFDAHVRVPLDAIVSTTKVVSPLDRGHVVRIGTLNRPLIDLDPVLDRIAEMAGGATAQKES